MFSSSTTILQSIDKHDYWQKKLEALAPLHLVTDFPETTEKKVGINRNNICIPSALSKKLITIATERGTTLQITLLTSLYVLLYRYTGQSDLCINANHHNTGTYPLRIDLSDNPTFHELLKQVVSVTHEADQNQVLNNMPLGITFSWNEKKATSPYKYFGIYLNHCDDDSVNGLIEYDANLFKPFTIKNLTDCWQTLLENIVITPENKVSVIPLLSDQAKKHLSHFNNTEIDIILPGFIHGMFSENAKKSPKKTAVVFHHELLPKTSTDSEPHDETKENNFTSRETITYEELDEITNELAAYLQHKEIGPDKIVGLCLPRSIHFVIAVISIFKAGGIIAPLEIEDCTSLRYKIIDTKLTMVLVNDQTNNLFSTNLSIVNINLNHLKTIRQNIQDLKLVYQKPKLTPENLAYIIYTSGTTGNPKGVMVPHRGLSNLANALAYRKFKPGSKMLCTAPPTFDAVFLEMFQALLLENGEAHFIYDRGRLSPVILQHVIKSAEINVAVLLPKVLANLDPKELPSLYDVTTMGATPDKDTIQQWLESGKVIRNEYGPTEATVCVTTHICRPNEPDTSIGHPIPNVKLLIWDPNGNELPIKFPGELVIAGNCLAAGYLNNPQLTAEKFPEKKYYKTGDYAYRDEDGAIIFLRRMDRQIKIHGIRIELDGIEARLKEHPLVKDAVVISPDQKTLLAYVVPKSNVLDITWKEKLNTLLVSTLPIAAKVTITCLQSLPLNANGKIDYKQLPKPAHEAIRQGEIVLPKNNLQGLLKKIWVDLLPQQADFGINHEFSDLGGDSMSIAKLEITLNHKFFSNAAEHVTVNMLFENNTIEKLATLLEKLILRARTNMASPSVSFDFIRRRRDQSTPGTVSSLSSVPEHRDVSPFSRLHFIGQQVSSQPKALANQSSKTASPTPSAVL